MSSLSVCVRAIMLGLGLGMATWSGPVWTAPQLPDFTYQGRLTQNGAPANGAFDLSFALFDAAVAGTQIGATVFEPAFPVSDGVFTVALAFPGAFAGEQRWLQVTVNGQPLLPRQPVSTVPVAQFALSGSIGGPAGGDLGGSFPNPSIANGAVTNAKIANLAVSSAKIADGAVTAAKLGTGSVTADAIGSGAVGTSELANGSVTLAKLASGGASGNISITIPGNSCADFAVAVNGSQVGDLVLFAWGANASVPVNLVVTGHRVSTAGQAVLRGCNHGTGSATVSDQQVRVRTLR